MEISEATELIELLGRIESKKSIVLVRAVSLLLRCCEKDSELGAVMIVRAPADEENWMLHVHALNLDIDDTYLALSKAAVQVADHIQAEAPPSEYLN